MMSMYAPSTLAGQGLTGDINAVVRHLLPEVAR